MSDAATRLARIREELDSVDVRLLDDLASRFELVRRVGTLKSEAAIPVMQPARVAAVVSRARSGARERGLDEDFVEKLFRMIIDEACRAEERVLDGAAR